MRQAALLVAVCLVVAPLAGAVGATDSTAQSTQDALEKEGVHITVELQPDGDAHWNVSARYALEDENDTAAFDDLAREFKSGDRNSGFSIDVFRAVAPDVSDEVGREMAIRNEEYTATTVESANNSTGVLSLRFTWTNFSQVTNETLTVDGFSGSWFGDLKAGQTLTVRPPEGYEQNTISPDTSVTDGAYQWRGPQAFEEDDPTLVFTESASGSGPGGVGAGVLLVVGLGGLALVVGGVFAWMYARNGSDAWFERDGSDESAGGDGQAATDGSVATADAGAAGSATADGPSDADSGDGGGGVDPELLSDEERVERLLREHDGRMKQSKIVEETRWSTAKVSQLLSSMDDEGRIEKLRIGRENLISLPGEGVGDE
ncbi:helix-turn-helix transcriptional regulator [Halobacterium litoreum]|uniref:Helix-turn-helix transcriptional regulator n=1 Tax=Halobacterium litoreum TaxID=2039234 RepID=A0ABD5NEB2_9EURY|nr:hypothetical protein [Halobacterium litoreum]UHH13530.1 hypothetical protein LT972_00705 [Halobacterium litoreum]